VTGDRPLGASMDVPFEPSPPGHLLDTTVQWSGGVVVMASTVDVPEHGVKPALVWRFAKPDGTFYPAITLVMDDAQMAKLRPLVMEAIALARRTASLGGGVVQ
jgi:hypothetical protein